MMTALRDQLEQLRIVPVVAIEATERAGKLADALIAGGLPCAEITLRTAGATEVIATLADRADFLVGAGTVHHVDQAKRVVDAGAKFIVTPGFNRHTVQWCIENKVPIFPGVATPSDLEQVLEFDLRIVKFFPAEALGGVKFLKALHGPYGDVRFIPTGGIALNNCVDYLTLPFVVACGGSWMVKPEWIAAGRFDEITRVTTESLRRIAENERE